MEAVFLAWYDYVLFALLLLVSLFIGIYFALSGDRQLTTQEFLSGNRRLAMVPVAVSMFMSLVSGVLVLGMTAEVYSHGMLRWFGAVPHLVGTLVSAFVFVPLFYPLKVTSIFQYYDMRFGSRTLRLFGTSLYLISQVLYIGMSLFVPAVAMETVTGLPVWVSVVVLSVVGIIYSTIGGIKAVIWTDVFQGGVMFAGIIIALVVGTIKVGGAKKVFEAAREGGRLQFFEWSVDPYLRMSTWTVTLGHLFDGITIGLLQNTVQRICATRSQIQATWTVVMQGVMFFICYTMSCFCGLIVFAYYHSIGCDPLSTGQIKSANQIFPFFIVEAVRLPGLPGLLLSVLFSGSLSSFSSSMNACSAVTWKDVLEPRLGHLAEHRKARVTKILVAFYGVVGTGFAFVFGYFSGNVAQVSSSVLASVFAPIAGILLLGALFPCANWIGAAIGGIVAFVFAFSCSMVNNLLNPYRPSQNLSVSVEDCWRYNLTLLPETPPNQKYVYPLFRLSFLLYAPLAVLLCITVGLIVSLATGKCQPQRLQPNLHIPLADRLCCYLPASVRIWQWCSVLQDQQTGEPTDSSAFLNSLEPNKTVDTRL